MKRTRNVLLLVLAVLLLFPWTLAAAGTEIIGTVDTEENALISAQLEAMAEEYVTKYIHTAYLYEEEDFVTGTLLEMSEETLAKTGLTTLKINGTEEKIADLQANLQQFADVAWYYMYTRSYQDINVVTVICISLAHFASRPLLGVPFILAQQQITHVIGWPSISNIQMALLSGMNT